MKYIEFVRKTWHYKHIHIEFWIIVLLFFIACCSLLLLTVHHCNHTQSHIHTPKGE